MLLAFVFREQPVPMLSQTPSLWALCLPPLTGRTPFLGADAVLAERSWRPQLFAGTATSDLSCRRKHAGHRAAVCRLGAARPVVGEQLYLVLSETLSLPVYACRK